LEYANAGTLDTSATATQSGVTSATVGPTASVGTTELAVGLIGYWNNGSTPSATSVGGILSERTNTGAAPNDLPIDVADNLSTHSGGQSASWTLGQSDNPGEVLAVFHTSGSNKFTAYNYTDDRLLQSV